MSQDRGPGLMERVSESERQARLSRNLRPDGSVKRGPNYRFTDEEIAYALRKASGIPLDAAEILSRGKRKITRSALYQRIRKSAYLMQVRWEAEQELLDLAESRLADKVADGDLQAVHFVLKTKGRGRGYTVRDGASGSSVEPGQGDIRFLTDDELEEQIRQLGQEREIRDGPVVDAAEPARIESG